MKHLHLPSLLVGALGVSVLGLLVSLRPAQHTNGIYQVAVGDSPDEVFVIDTRSGETWRRLAFGKEEGTLADHCRGPESGK